MTTVPVEMIEELDPTGYDHKITTVHVTPGVIDRQVRKLYRAGQCYALAICLARRMGWPVLLAAHAGVRADADPADLITPYDLIYGWTDNTTGKHSTTIPLHVLEREKGLRGHLMHHAVAISPDLNFMFDIHGYSQFWPERCIGQARVRQYLVPVDAEELAYYLSQTDGAKLDYELADTFAVALMKKAGLEVTDD